MFSINQIPIRDECNNLITETKKMYNLVSDVNDVISSLRTLTGLEGAISDLSRTRNNMLDEYDTIWQVTTVLEKTLTYYLRCEKDICNNCEENIVTYVRQKVMMNNFSGLESYLRPFQTK